MGGCGRVRAKHKAALEERSVCNASLHVTRRQPASLGVSIPKAGVMSADHMETTRQRWAWNYLPKRRVVGFDPVAYVCVLIDFPIVILDAQTASRIGFA